MAEKDEEMEALKGMSLDDAVDALPDGVVFAVGAKSGFVFIGGKEEYREDVQAVTDEWRDRYIRLVGKTVRKLKLAVNRLEDAKSAKPATIADVLKMGAAVIDASDGIPAAVAALDGAYELLAGSKPFGERAVQKADRSIDPYGDKDVMLVVEGTEEGDVWLRSEYAKKRRAYGGKEETGDENQA